MTVVVTLPGGTIDKYMRSGDAYAQHHDGTLDVVRLGAKRPYSYGGNDLQGGCRRRNKVTFVGSGARSDGAVSDVRV